MGVEFRQRGIGEIFGLLWRRKLLIVLPTLAVTLAVWWVVSKLPSVYESTTLLTIRPPSISNNVIRPLSEEDISQRLNAITEEVKSRSSLEPMVTKYNLFQSERAGGVPMELLIEKMRSGIKVEMENMSSGEKVPAFRISCRDREANSARNVCAELASKYIKAQQDAALSGSQATREFFEKQLADTKQKLDEIDKQRLNYMLQNVDKLPNSAAGLIAQLNGLYQQEKTMAEKEKAVEAEIGRMRDNRALLERQKNDLREYGEKQTMELTKKLNDPKNTPAYGELIKKRADLKSQLDILLTQFKPKHPEVIAKQSEIENINREIAKLEETAKKNDDEAREMTQGRLDLQIKNLENEQQRIAGEIGRQEQIISQIRTETGQVRLQIGDLQQRINSIPNAEVALESFNRDYQTAKGTYEEMLKKKNDADLQTERERNLQGEKISIVDHANVPQSPVAPKRAVLVGAGAAFGLVIGFLFAAIFEFPRLLTIQNPDDAKHYTGLPVLASVPELLTPTEMRWRTIFGFAKALAAVAIAAASIPVLIFALQISHVFDRFVS